MGPYAFIYVNDVLKTIKKASGNTEYERFELTSENGVWTKIERYRMGKVISVLEIAYDKEGRVISQVLKDDKGSLLFVNSIQYENGDGNDEVFFKFYDWELNIYLNAITYTIRPHWL